MSQATTGRNIIVLSDGTGNSAAKLFKTNVWRLYQALDLSHNGQIAYYDDGVGTSSVKPLALLGGVFGWGLKRNVLDLYTFLCRNYREGDRIYAFGFSRGAFTIRVLIRFVLAKGLVEDRYSNAGLRRRALRLYREFRKEQTTHAGLHTPMRWLRDRAVALLDALFRSGEPPTTVTKIDDIEFVGVWDTVDAYGLPVETLERGINRWVWPLSIDDTELHPAIHKACHALSIDDRRKAFHPLLWNEPEDRVPDEAHTDLERLTQVWFAGMHANVGGGYPDDSLSSVALRWIIHEAQKRGLAFNRLALVNLDGAIAPYGPIYNSRAGLGAYYQYKPRPLDPPCDWLGAKIAALKVHETVVWRMAAGGDAYAPLNLPADFRVLVGPDSAVPTPPDPQVAANPLLKPNVVTFDRYRVTVRTTADQIGGPAGQEADTEKRQRVAREFTTLDKPKPDQLQLIRDTVWWRRFAYYVTLLVTLSTVTLLIFPGLIKVIQPEPTMLDQSLLPLVRRMVRLIEMFTPAALHDWLRPFTDHPLIMLGSVAAIFLCLMWGTHLDQRLHDRALRAWNARWRLVAGQSFGISVRARYGVATLMLLVWLCATVLGVVLLGKTLGSLTSLSPNEEEWMVYLRFAALGLLTTASSAVAVGILVWIFSLRKLARQALLEQREIPGFSLAVARRLQDSQGLAWVNRQIFGVAVPVAFTLFIVGLVLVVGNRVAFSMLSAGGMVCRASKAEEKRDHTFEVPYNSGCVSSAMRLLADRTYQVSLDLTPLGGAPPDRAMPPPPVRPDRPKPTAVAASSAPASGDLWMWLSTLPRLPLLRKWEQPWHTIILRIGHNDDEHYFLVKETIEITPKRTGELFVFVNEAVLGVPYAYDVFYQGTGKAKLHVRWSERKRPGVGDIDLPIARN